MFVSRGAWIVLIREQEEMERRIKRLELMLYEDAKNKIASLEDKEAGSVVKDGASSIEAIISRCRQDSGSRKDKRYIQG